MGYALGIAFFYLLAPKIGAKDFCFMLIPISLIYAQYYREIDTKNEKWLFWGVSIFAVLSLGKDIVGPTVYYFFTTIGVYTMYMIFLATMSWIWDFRWKNKEQD